MSSHFLYFCALLCLGAVRANHRLNHISTLYVPLRYGDPDEFVYDAGVAEQLAVDPVNYYVYTVGNNMIHIIDFNDATDPMIVGYVTLFNEGAGSICDITVCGDWVAVGVDNIGSPAEGNVLIYSRYDATADPTMTLLYDITVGAVPDSAHFTLDCSKLIVVIEGEPRNVDGVFTDFEGGAGVVDFQGDPGTAEPIYTFVNFTSFNDKEADYIAKGVRKVFESSANPTTFSQDLEPENVALSYDDAYAYFTLQENNAIAVLDIAALSWVDIYAMGEKSFFEDNRLDASDDDGVNINISNWPIRSFYLADAIKFINIDGTDYLMTANEGDAKEYDTDLGLAEPWTESERGETLVNDNLLSPAMPQAIVEMLGDDSKLGRLEVSVVDGLDASGKIKDIYAYGGRSVSIYRVDNMTQVFDTGDELEIEIALLYPSVFNANARGKDEFPEDSKDGRSDNSGPEADTIEYGYADGETLVFVGMERPGFIAVYQQDMVNGKPHLLFESMFYGGGPIDSGSTWQELYDAREITFTEPEDMKFLPPSQSPTGRNLLIVSGSVSGTIAFFDVNLVELPKGQDLELPKGQEGKSMLP